MDDNIPAYDPTNRRNDVVDDDDDGLIPSATANSRNWNLLRDTPSSDSDDDGGREDSILPNQSPYVSDNPPIFTAYMEPEETETPANGETPGSTPSSRNTPSFRAGSRPVLQNWKPVLSAHGDGKAKLDNLNPEFGQRLATTFNALDATPFKGQYRIISGERSFAQQKALYEGYGKYDAKGNRIGETHMVAAPGTSLHELGVAIDVEFTGKKEDAAAFYTAFHEIGEKNGLQFVKGDINHAQLDDPTLISQLRQERGGTQLASARNPGLDTSPAV